MTSNHSHFERMISNHSHFERMISNHSHFERMIPNHSHFERMISNHSHFKRMISNHSHFERTESAGCNRLIHLPVSQPREEDVWMREVDVLETFDLFLSEGSRRRLKMTELERGWLAQKMARDENNNPKPQLSI